MMDILLLPIHWACAKVIVTLIVIVAMALSASSVLHFRQSLAAVVERMIPVVLTTASQDILPLIPGQLPDPQLDPTQAPLLDQQLDPTQTPLLDPTHILLP
jgi:hypothetical protein